MYYIDISSSGFGEVLSFGAMLLLFAFIIITVTFVFRYITKYIGINRVFLFILVIILCAIQYNYTGYSAFSSISAIEGFKPVIVSYVLFILCYFRKYRELSFKEICMKREYLAFLLFIIIYIIYAAVTYVEPGILYLIVYDAYILNVLIMIRAISYVYIHSFAEDIKLTKPEWTTRILWYYQGVLKRDAENIEQFRLEEIIAKILKYVTTHPIITTAMVIILGGPQFLIVVEMFRLSSSLRKFTKKYNLFILDASILFNLIFMTIAIILVIQLFVYRLTEF